MGGYVVGKVGLGLNERFEEKFFVGCIYKS